MTDKEKLSCLIDRPCTACKFHNEDGCVKWSCVFDQKSESPEGEYIKKSDVLDKAVIETLSDYTEHDVVHVDEINKLPTYSAPKREKGEWIPTIERLPEIGDTVLCSVKTPECTDHHIIICKYCAEEFWKDGTIRAWQPLPEPYKKGGAE